MEVDEKVSLLDNLLYRLIVKGLIKILMINQDNKN